MDASIAIPFEIRLIQLDDIPKTAVAENEG
jgi:hypothetical protein